MHWALGWIASALTGVTTVTSTYAGDADKSPPAETWSTSNVTHPSVYDPVRVFSAGDAGVTCYRIPAGVKTARGTLLAFAEARRKDCSDIRTHQLALRRSSDGGRTWSPVTFPVGSWWRPACQPYPIALADGTVALLFTRRSRNSSEMGYGNGIIFSYNDGLSWGRPKDITKDFGEQGGNQMGPGAGVQLSNGRLLAVSHHDAYQRDVLAYSDDGGHRWHTIDHNFTKMDEGTLADLGQGHVIINMRHKQEMKKGRGVARSYDGGLTWSKMTFDRGLKGPDCQGSLAEINGRLFFSNPYNTTHRANLTVRRSDDGGHTWRWHYQIQQNESSGYSSLFNGVVGPGRGGVIYESANQGGAIDFRAFPLRGEEEANAPSALEGLSV